MRLLLLFLFLLCVSPSGFSQEERIYFSEAIATHLPKYQEKANKAYRVQDVERAQFLFDSLIEHCLKGSYLDNFKMHNLRKKEVLLDDFQKPVFLRTYASWLVPSEGEIPALNKLAEEYQTDLQIVVLFWDTRKAVKRLAKKFNSNITVLYLDELQNKSPGVIKTMKHSLGFPTTFLLDQDNRIVDIRRSISHPFGIDSGASFDLNYDSISNGISALLVKDLDDMNSTRDRMAKSP